MKNAYKTAIAQPEPTASTGTSKTVWVPKINRSSDPAPTDRSIKPVVGAIAVFAIPILAVASVNSIVAICVRISSYGSQMGWW